MTNYKRADRVADLIRSEISDICMKQLRDPRVGSITITDVHVTDDLKIAKIFFVRMGQDDCPPETINGLDRARGFLRRELGKRLQLRLVPELIFVFDETFVHGSRIEKLLAEVRTEGEQDG